MARQPIFGATTTRLVPPLSCEQAAALYECFLRDTIDIGLGHPALLLLHAVRMSTPHFLADTLHLAGEEGLRVELLPTWYDVDDVASPARSTAELSEARREVAPQTRIVLERHPGILASVENR